MKPFIKYSIIFFISFAVAGSFAYYAVRLYTQSAQEVILPELKGKNILYVLETLTQMGLNAKLYGTQFDESIPKYAVISQDPVPGTTTKKGRDVAIYISKGKKQTIMPDLRQLMLSQGLIALEKNEFTKGHLSYTFSSVSDKNRIISQFPKPFTNISKGTVCNLLVSRGIKTEGKMMPNLLGSSLANAAQKIENIDLNLFNIKSDQNNKKTLGIVLSQQPKPGSFVDNESRITLVINNDVKNRTMSPNRLNTVRFLQFQLEPGFVKSHVRVETDLFGPIFDLYNEFMPPGENVHVLIPTGKKTIVNIYVDEQLKKTITIDPWSKEIITGDESWELSPLPFYPQTLQNLEMN